MNITQAGAAARTSYIPPRSGEAGQQMETESFLDAVARMSQSRADTGVQRAESPDPVSVYQSMMYAAGQTPQVEDTSATGAVSLEEMLKAKYPNLTYLVFDAGSSYWLCLSRKKFSKRAPKS